MRDLGNNLTPAQMIPAAIHAANHSSTVVDLTGFEGAFINVNTGIEGVTFGAGVHIQFKLMDSPDSTTFTEVAQSGVTDASITAGVFLKLDDNAETPQVSGIGYIGGERYLRVDVVFTGSHSTGTAMSTECIKGFPHHAGGASTYALA